jgi:hypothetical protein
MINDKITKSLAEAATQVMNEAAPVNKIETPQSPLSKMIDRAKTKRETYFKNLKQSVKDKAANSQANKPSSAQVDAEGGREGRNAYSTTKTGTGAESTRVKDYGRNVSKHQVPGQKYTTSRMSDRAMIDRQDADIKAMSKTGTGAEKAAATAKPAQAATAKPAQAATAKPAQAATAKPAQAATAKPAQAATVAAKPADVAAERQQRMADVEARNKAERAERMKNMKVDSQKAHIASGEKDPMGSEDKAQYNTSITRTPETPEKKGFFASLKDKASKLPGYHAGTGEQVGFDKDESGEYKRSFVGKREPKGPFEEDYTFADIVASLVESSYSIKSDEKERILENIHERFDNLCEDKGLKLKMSKNLSGAGVEIEPVDTGRGVARSLEPNATEKQKRAYEREVEAELAKKTDLVGTLEPHKDKTQQSKKIYHPLDQLSDKDAEKMLKAKFAVSEEASSEEFDKEIDVAKKKATGKIVNKEIAKASVQGVQNEEVELDEGKMDDYLDKKRLEADRTEPWDKGYKAKKKPKSFSQYVKGKRYGGSKQKEDKED